MSNNTPTITDSVAAVTDEDVAITVTQAELLANASDVDGDALFVSNLIVSGPDATIVDNGDGTWTITPTENYHGDISFSYDVSDGTEIVAGALDLTVTPVNDAPTAEGGKIVLNGSETANWKLHGHDVDGDNLTFSGIDETGAVVSAGSSFITENGGTVTINSDGSYNYQASSKYAGTDSFNYQVLDEHGAVSEATVNVIVMPEENSTVGRFDGNDDFLTTSVDTLSDTPTKFTMHTTFKVDDFGDHYNLLNIRGDSGSHSRTELRVIDTGALEFIYHDGTGKQINVRTSDSDRVVGINEWVSVAFVYDSTAEVEQDRLKIYLNGKQLAIDPAYSDYPSENETTHVLNAMTKMQIGARKAYGVSGNTMLFDGDMASMTLIDGRAADINEFGGVDENGVWYDNGGAGVDLGPLGFNTTDLATPEFRYTDDASPYTWTSIGDIGSGTAVIESEDLKQNSNEGTSGNDVLEGDIGDNTLSGHANDDLLIGNAGGDILLGGSGDDTLYGDRINTETAQSSPTTVDGITTIYADVNNDGNIDAIMNADDGRIWTRLGDGQGGFGDASFQNTGYELGISKVSGAADWGPTADDVDASAYSAEKFAGAGEVTFEIPNEDSFRVFGLSTTSGGSSFKTINYGLNTQPGGNLYVLEDTVFTFVGTYSTSDDLSIERLDTGTVVYKQNGTIIHTSSNISNLSDELLVDVAFNEVGGALGEVTMSVDGGPSNPVSWIADDTIALGLSGDISVAYEDLNNDGNIDAIMNADDGRIWTRLGDGQGGFGDASFQNTGYELGISKVSGAADWGPTADDVDASAYSAEKFAGAGEVTFEIPNEDSFRVFGLSTTSGGSSFKTINYGLNTQPGGNLYVLEDTVFTFVGTYSTGDDLSIERLDTGTVVYKQNGTIIHTSSNISNLSDELLVDVAFNEVGGALGEVTMSVDGGPSNPVSWVADDTIALGLSGDISVAYEDLNNDGNIDAIMNTDDGRIWTRLGDGQGGFGDASFQNTGYELGISKVSGAADWGPTADDVDASAYSAEKFAGAGEVTFEIPNEDSFRVFGLSTTSGGSSFKTINYGLNTQPGGNLYVLEDTVFTFVGTYSTGDDLSIERLDTGTVVYKQNGTIIHTSSNVSNLSDELLVDVAFNEVGGALGEVTMSVDGGPSNPVSWIADDTIALGLSGDISVAYEDLNNDGNIDAIMNADDGRIWTRLGDGQGGFGDVELLDAGESPYQSITGNDVLDGGAGNDTLSGGLGDDIYQFSIGGDQDIIDNADTDAANSTDKIVFGADIDETDIWFRQDGDDLVAQILGMDDQVTISDWFDSSNVNYQSIDQFEVSDGSVLTASNVQSLVDAMSSFTVDQITNDTIESNSDHDDAQNVIAATWS
ncbi:tandem-95 repeat protein [Curvivirga sp.]|uniref:tandem-95 repeat protein n=1 Tax=Curvivirga sp. TaxID=2856848 RepID=UPI003B5C318E